MRLYPMERLPPPSLAGTGSASENVNRPGPLRPGGSSFVATARYEVQKKSLGRHTEVIQVKLKVQGGSVVPVVV